MSVPATADDLIKVIRKSGLIDEAKLGPFLQSHGADGLLQSDARKLAAVTVRDGLLTYFQAEQFLLGKWRGFTLGKYKLLERIGVGGMGQVFLAEHMYMRKRMALKVLPPTKAEDPVALGRFYREARVASSLDHQNIVRTVDIDQDGPLHFLVMEYVDGTTLLDIVKKFGPMNVLRASHYIRQTAIGLQYASHRGMIHRDIKPGNIILDRKGTAKLLDMGLARFYRDEQDQITIKYDDKNVLGTADYIAPEQTRDSRNIDVRADIYGLGASFYFLLTGLPPFPEPTVAEKILGHQTRKPRAIRELRPEVPQGLTKIIDKMMAKDPKERYQTPQEIVDALEGWTGEPINPPAADEMPKLSPAAMETSHVGAPPLQVAVPVQAPAPTPALATPQVRDASHVKPEETSRHRSMSASMLVLPDVAESAYENAMTVPVPADLRAAMAAATAGTGAPKPSSVVDLVMPPPTRANGLGAKPPGSIGSGLETRALGTATDHTPQHTAPPRPPVAEMRPAPPEPPQLAPARPVLPRPAAPRPPAPQVRPPQPAPVAPPLESPKLPPDLLKLSKSKTPGLEPKRHEPTVVPPKPASPVLPKPPVITPPSIAGRVAPPQPVKPPSAHGLTKVAGLETARPAEVTPAPAGQKLRSSTPDLKTYLAEKAAKPPTDRPKIGSWNVQLPASANRPLSPSSQPPVYRPPTRMPFFDQPVVMGRPTVLARILRWILMFVISSMIGVTLGMAIWSQFLRQN